MLGVPKKIDPRQKGGCMVKINRIIISMVLGGIVISNVHYMLAMPVIDKPIKKADQKIATRNKVLTVAAIATLLAIPATYVTRLAHQYVKEYGMATVAVALRYGLPFQSSYLKTLMYAASHDDQALKNTLIALHTLLIGENWRQTRLSLIDDFVKMTQREFNQKYGALMGNQVKHLLKTYGAASDLYFRKSNIRTYTRGTPSLKNQAKYREELDQAVGLS